MGRPSSWSQEQIDYLKSHYSDGDWDDLIQNCGHAKTNITSKASALRIRRVRSAFTNYTNEEIALIRKYWSSMPDNVFADTYMPYRTTKSIQEKASRIGLYKTNCKYSKAPYSAEEDVYIREHYTKESASKMAKHLGRSKVSLINRMKVLGATDCTTFAFSPRDDDFIREHYDRMSDEDIGAVLHRSRSSIKERRRHIGCYRRAPNTTRYPSLERFLHRNNQPWRIRAMEKWNYRCAITEKHVEDIHHLVSNNVILQILYAELQLSDDFDINTCSDEERDRILTKYIEIENRFPDGVCLTSNMHILFHTKYGYGNNTPEQFKEFVTSIAPDRVSAIFD